MQTDSPLVCGHRLIFVILFADPGLKKEHTENTAHIPPHRYWYATLLAAKKLSG